MYDLEHYPAMMDLLFKNFPQYLRRNGAIAMSCLSSRSCNDASIGPLLLVSKSCPLSLTFIYRLVCLIHAIEPKRLPALSKHTIEGVFSNAYMFQIEMRNHHMVELFDFISNLCEQRRPEGDKRHIVVINLIDKMKPGTVLGIKSILTRFSTSAIFILRNDACVYIAESIKSIVQQIPLVFDYLSEFKTDFERVASIKLPLIEYCNDPMDYCIMAESPGTKFDALQTFVGAHMNKLNNAIDQPLDVYSKVLRDFCIKIGAACVPISAIAIEILKWFRLLEESKRENKIQNNGKSNMTEILHILAEMEHGAAIVTKPLFVLEQKMNELIHYINGRPV